jgi:hypothetical protein
MVLVSQAGEGGLVPEDVAVHQLLCGREIARDRKVNPLHQMAAQMANYCYLVADVESKKACIIDPAWDTDGCFAVADELGFEIQHALFTRECFELLFASPHFSFTDIIDYCSRPAFRPHRWTGSEIYDRHRN